MESSSIWKGAAGLCLLGLIGCSGSAPAKPFEVTVKVEGDPGVPLAGADVLHNNSKVASTKADGSALLKLRGAEGESLSFMVKCPDGFQSPSKSLNVTLRRLADPTKRPEYNASCPPTTRTVVVAIRAEEGGNLPVMYLGREIAKTDEAGGAHVLLTLRPSETFQLMLKTDDNPQLKPQNPVANFAVKMHDEVIALDQKFTVEKKKVVRGPGRVGPKRL